MAYFNTRNVDAENILRRIKDERPVTQLLNDCYKAVQQLDHTRVELLVELNRKKNSKSQGDDDE